MPEDVAMPNWVSKYVGNDKANLIKSKVENPEDEIHFSNSIDTLDGIDEDEWLAIIAQETYFANLDGASVSEYNDGDLHINAKPSEYMVSDCYDIDALAEDYNLDKGEVIKQILNVLMYNNGINDISKVNVSELSIPTLPEITRALENLRTFNIVSEYMGEEKAGELYSYDNKSINLPENVQLDAEEGKLYLKGSDLTEDAIYSCYDIEALAQEMGVKKSYIKGLICECIKIQNGVYSLNQVEKDKNIYLPTISELEEAKQIYDKDIIAAPEWVSAYIGEDKAKEIMDNIKNNADFLNEIADVNISNGIDENEWRTIISSKTNFNCAEGVKLDIENDAFYLELDAWDENLVYSCYDIEALAHELSITEDEVKNRINQGLIGKNNISDLTKIKNGTKLTLPTISEISNPQNTQNNTTTTNPNQTTGDPTDGSTPNTNVDIENAIQDIYSKFLTDPNIDIEKELNNLGILGGDFEPKTFEAGLQAMYYAFGKDWNLIESMMKYSKTTGLDSLEIPFAEKLDLALERCDKGEKGLNKEDIKKAYLTYYGSLSDIPSAAKESLGITADEEIQNDLDELDISNPEKTKETLEDIITKIENGDSAQPGTINAELLALKEIYGDEWKDKVLPILEENTDSDGKLNLEVGSLTDDLFDEWLNGTETFDDQKMLNACKKFYGHESLWPEANNLDKKNVKVLIDTCKAMNEFNLGKIDETELKSKLKSLNTQIDELSDQPTKSFLAGLKALRVAWGDEWVDNFIGKAKLNNDNLGDIDFTSAIENFAQKHETNPDKIKEVCNIYFGEGHYPDSINTILGIETTGGNTDSSNTLAPEDVARAVNKLHEEETKGWFGWSTDNSGIFDIIMGYSPDELNSIVAAYDANPPGDYASLEEMISEETSGQAKEILLQTIKIAKGECIETYTDATVEKMADDLWDATGAINGTNHADAYLVLVNAPDEKLKDLAEYLFNNKGGDKYNGKTLEQIIRDDFKSGSNDDLDALLVKLKRLGITDKQLSNGNQTTSSKNNESGSTTQAFQPASNYLYGGSPQQTDPAMPGQKYYYQNH